MQITSPENIAATVLSLLQCAAVDQSASSIYQAVAIIRRANRDRKDCGSLNLEFRGRLLTALVDAKMGAQLNLPVFFARRSLDIGFCALAYQIAMWSEDLEKTSRRLKDDVTVLNIDAQIFENEIHNLWLLEQKSARQADRYAFESCHGVMDAQRVAVN